MKVIGLLCLSFFIMSCSSLSKEECQMGNWYEYGSRDATKGEPSSRFQKHVEACEKYQVKPSKEKYMKGFSQGLEVFCQPDNAYTFGRSGGRYQNTCPAAKSLAFRSAYQKGKEVFDITSEIKRLGSEIDRLSNEVTSSAITNERRTSLVYQLREKERKKSDLEKRLLVIELKQEVRQ